MDTSPALLLLLTLGFCCPGIYGQSLEIKVRSPKDITQLRLGQKLELECHTDKSHGASWILRDSSGTLRFIAFISSVSRATFEGGQRTSPRFEASKDNTIYRLAVKSFTPQDEGSYFCVMNLNQMLHFSPGQRAFLPGQQHFHPALPSPAKMPSTSSPCPLNKQAAAPSWLLGDPLYGDPIHTGLYEAPPELRPFLCTGTAMPSQESRKAGEMCFILFPYMLNPSISLAATTEVAPSTPGPTTQGGITEGDSCLKTPDPDSRMQEDLDSSCLVFLWLRLAGFCLLLLQLLATTIVLHQLKAHHEPPRGAPLA
ncbi:uncharacterized protein LOC119700412 [Motacilla alba alba]|uniref:uncharacterized protein LOC119700412 n=1 Tax=Motacilla alba alba TaxID=1094192 RepID=UPI0018D509A4|nr:uncharacterized protein LOC119700412 [Motacilla alba alba]